VAEAMAGCAAYFMAAIRPNGSSVTRPRDIPQVATAQPSTSAKGREMPFLVTIVSLPPWTDVRSTQPCGNGSNPPSSLGRGRPCGASRPARSTRPPGRSSRSVPAERSPRRASPRVMPSARPSQAGQLLTVHRCADWSRTSRANRPDDRPGLPYGADVQSRSGVHDLRLRGLSSPGWLRGGRRG